MQTATLHDCHLQDELERVRQGLPKPDDAFVLPIDLNDHAAIKGKAEVRALYSA
jgi:hypothetical protein